MEVRHPDTGDLILQDDGRPVTIRLAGADSTHFQRIARHNLNRRLKAQRSGRRMANEITAEDLDRERLEQLVGCTLAWEGIAVDNETVECTPENARNVYTRFRWLREAAEDFQTDRSNFLKASPKN